MENIPNEPQPIFSHAEPVLAVNDVNETIKYWHQILGFPVKWTWGEPPVHGAVSWHKAFIQFTHNPELAKLSKGNSVWIRLRHIESLYNFHKKKNTEIVAPLENKPWGMAQYTLRELNGYFIHFAAPMAEREKSEARLPSSVKIIGRKPSVKEYHNLASSVGWTAFLNEPVIESILSSAIFAVIAEDAASNETIGCAVLLGDNASFYYVKDVIVHPHWQSKRVGTAMMQELNRWLDTYGANNALVALITGETLEPFYQRFGFAQAFSMIKYISRDKEKSNG